MKPVADWNRAWPAPAKLNLFLHVVGRRADGYHLLQTAFRFIDFADTLRFAPREDGPIRALTPPLGVAEQDDLCVRAARLLQRECAVRSGVAITLEKRIPMGGGLGGGSSDAASTLIALNHLWGCGLSSKELQRLGLTLGADVPLFIQGRATFAEGIGEVFTPLSLAPAWYLVTCPPVTTPTARIFSATDLPRATTPIRAADWRPGAGGNDLEAVACRLYPPIARHLEWLRTQVGNGHMSGSGACCFAEFATEDSARAAFRRLPADMRGLVVCGLDTHPLLEFAP